MLSWLEGGDLRSDGLANQVAEAVLQRPEVFGDLARGLRSRDPVVRGRAADALEKVSRARPELLLPILPAVARAARSDPLPMVRFHMAMILGSLATFDEVLGRLTAALHPLLQDESAFVRSWAVVGLCLVVRRKPSRGAAVLRWIGELRSDESIAVRTRARMAMAVLTGERERLPAGWVKSRLLQDAGAGEARRG